MGARQVIHKWDDGPVLAVLGRTWAEPLMGVPMEQSRKVPVAGWSESLPVPGHA